jgi:hypothetical protein
MRDACVGMHLHLCVYLKGFDPKMQIMPGLSSLAMILFMESKAFELHPGHCHFTLQ